MPETVLDEGVYCNECGYFEENQILEGRCLACGCEEQFHTHAKVVKV